MENKMPYQNLGRSGLKVSRLSFGSWVTFGKQVDLNNAANLMSMAKENGVNFYDNAEVYSYGAAEEIMGAVFKKLAWPRISYIVSTKFFWGISGDINGTNTLNRKYLMQAMEGSLKRFEMDYVDLVYCHRPDPNTPIEETVRAMNDIIEKGQALYWGTSEWGATEIREAWNFAEKNGLHKPIVEQPEYNLLNRKKVDQEFSKLYKDIGLGLTTWSPLASGLLTGKYRKGIPEGSRLALGGMSWLKEMFDKEPQKKQQVEDFCKLAEAHQFSPAQLSIAWCLANANVSTVILGAKDETQLKENLAALDVLPKLTADLKKQIEKIFPLD